LDVEAEVLKIVAPNTLKSECGETNLDSIAVIKVDGIEIVLRTSRETFMNYQPMEALGINLKDKSVIVVKSANNFSAGHEAIAGSFLYLETPGKFDPLTANYKKINRAIWPFVDDPFKIDGS